MNKKKKYADTIREKCEGKTAPAKPAQKPLFFLNRPNALLWPLFLSPLFTLLYAPVNRHVILPLLGSGRPYVDMDGVLVEEYFSANSLARILFYLLIAATAILLLRTTRGLSKKIRIPLLIVSALLNILLGIVFLEFTLWE